MKIEARTIKSLVSQSNGFEAMMLQLDEIITKSTEDLPREIFITPSMTMIGYGLMPYKKASDLDMWPLIGLAPQKNTVNLYVMANKDGNYLPELYKDELNASSIGKSCIRFKDLDNADLKALKKLLKEASDYYHNHKLMNEE